MYSSGYMVVPMDGHFLVFMMKIMRESVDLGLSKNLAIQKLPQKEIESILDYLFFKKLKLININN